MKRLVRKAMTQTLYHGTTLNRFQQIVESGQIMPNESRGGNIHSGVVWEYSLANNMSVDEAEAYINNNYYGCVFLATTPDVAKKYMSYTVDRSPGVIIEVQLPEDALLPDDTDFPYATKWQETAEKGQVKVLGPVTDNYFTGVTFIYGSGDSQKVYQTSYWNWEAELEAQRAKSRSEFQERLKRNREKGQQMIDQYNAEQGGQA